MRWKAVSSGASPVAGAGVAAWIAAVTVRTAARSAGTRRSAREIRGGEGHRADRPGFPMAEVVALLLPDRPVAPERRALVFEPQHRPEGASPERVAHHPAPMAQEEERALPEHRGQVADL